MGNQVSSTNEVVIDISTALNMTTNIIQNNSSQITQTAGRSNQFSFETAEGSNVRIGKFNIFQKIDGTSQATGEISGTVINQLNVDLKSTLDAAVDQAAQAKSGIFSFGDSVSTTNINKTKNALNIAIDTVVTQNNWSASVQNVLDINNATITLRGNFTADELPLDQTLFSSLIARNVIDSIINNANTVLAQNNSNVRVSQRASSSAGLFGGSGGMIAGVISSVISLSMCIILLIIFLKLKSKNQ